MNSSHPNQLYTTPRSLLQTREEDGVQDYFLFVESFLSFSVTFLQIQQEEAWLICLSESSNVPELGNCCAQGVVHGLSRCCKLKLILL